MLCFLSSALPLFLSLSNINAYSQLHRFSQSGRKLYCTCHHGMTRHNCCKSWSGDQRAEEDQSEKQNTSNFSWDKDKPRENEPACFSTPNFHFWEIAGVNCNLTSDNLTNSTFAHKCLIQEIGGIQGDCVWSLHINRSHLFTLLALLKLSHHRLLYPSPDEQLPCRKNGVKRVLRWRNVFFLQFVVY